MNALVLCGGRGSRLDADMEKPLYEVAGTPMVDHVVAALRDADHVASVYAAVSPNAPATADYLSDASDAADAADAAGTADATDAADATGATGVQVVRTPGEGYVADLGTALDTVGTPAVTVAADLPLLSGEHVDAAIEAGRETAGPGTSVASVTVQTPARLKRQIGVSADEAGNTDTACDGDDTRDGDEPAWLPTGLNVVGDGEEITHRSWDARLAVNVNYERDAAIAEALAGER